MHAGWHQLYRYTSDLMCLDFCRPSSSQSALWAPSVSTPLVTASWADVLASHPDQAFASYIVRGLQEGFRIGYSRCTPLQSAQVNMQSAREHPEIIADYIQKELSLGRLLGPLTPSETPQATHINRFGVIPKGHNTNKWRLITDLSFPHGASVNDGIDPAFCSLSYTTVDDVAAIIATQGQGAMLAKIDIAAAYRLIPVHPQDRHLQAMCWEGHVYMDLMLPFGLRSAPKIFNAVADALNWHLEREGIDNIRHYLDDFTIVAPPTSPTCQRHLDILNRECIRLGVPIADHKRDGPTTQLTFLGIEIDTKAGQLRLPAMKLTRIIDTLREWEGRDSCLRKELESLVGLLHHACKVVRSGRSFLRRMIDLLHGNHRSPNSRIPIRLNAEFRSDLAWWIMFIAKWNGISFLAPPHKLPQVHLTSDASGSWGCGAWHGTSWFQLKWDSSSIKHPIAEKELIPIIVACVVWGANWRGHQVICHCDNQVVVACLRSRTSKTKGLMYLIRCLVFIEAKMGCFLVPTYIDTHTNHLADDLSRDNLRSFLSKVPAADKQPTRLPQPLLTLLMDAQADWTSPRWRQQFSTTFNSD